ncbi:hypothetical protein ACIGXM_30945 [Kitasatospora sp. NPDC052896]|uniref:hypothetical protein n=1 Tax=Kitasatospora sp. NPDC052896 TaxID=3364061 RepID=UPI0037C5697C
MSLSTRAIAGLGAVVVIGAGTLGGSIAYASSQPAPIKTQATVTVGRNSFRFEPPAACWNGGQPLTDAGNTACGNLSKNPAQFPVITVNSTDRIGVGVDPDTANNGWRAYTNGGGAQGSATIASYQKGNTFSGLQPASDVLATSRDTTLTVIEFDPKTANSAQPGILGVWFFTLRDNALPPAAAGSQDTSTGQ